MAASTAQRRGAKPVLKSGAKWPAITLHNPPMLQSTCSFEGSEACRDLQKHLMVSADLLQPEAVPDEAADAEDSTADGCVVGEKQALYTAEPHEEHHSSQPVEDTEHAAVKQCSGVLAT